MTLDPADTSDLLSNLYADAQSPAQGERFHTLLKHHQLHIERIVSGSDVAPVDMVQTQDEWVVLIRGEAELLIQGLAHPLREGDHVFIPAGVSHRVASVSSGAMWLAVHLHPDTPTSPE
jgi:cupin 2 domain-containing protein